VRRTSRPAGATWPSSSPSWPSTIGSRSSPGPGPPAWPADRPSGRPRAQPTSSVSRRFGWQRQPTAGQQCGLAARVAASAGGRATVWVGRSGGSVSRRPDASVS
jgi:hypothetical protein